MPLSAGSRLGSYEILALIGAGGMGEVYRARDTKLNREVAIKVLPAAFANDSDRMARFEREAQVLASLNHPHIAAIYGLEESDGMRALVMELVEGPTLGEHICGRAMALEEALPIAKQITEALEYAHEKGIIHRDLKPVNVKLTADGHVKLLDFGLAKALEAPAPAVGNPSISPTLTIEGTRAGVILGTAAYMAPEQARGKAVDKRADIWSFGVVLYEMLTGKQPFAGATVSDTLAAVLKTEPDLTQAPVQGHKLLRRCLDKDPKRRLRDIGDVWELLEQPAATIDSKRKSELPWALVGLATVAFIMAALGWWRATRPMERALQPLMRLSVDLGSDAVAGQFTTTAISPDGGRLVFPAKSPEGKQMLSTRLLEETKPTLLSGTENGRDPFFSPDGKWIGFFADGKMKKISIQGGAPIALCDAPDARGANWAMDSNIIVALNRVGGLSRVSVEGGTPQPVTKLEGGGSHRWPQPLPGNEAVLFTLSSSNVVFGDASIASVSLKTGEIKILVRDAYFGRYVPTGDLTGHLVYVHDGVLFGVPFDPARLELRGTPVPVLEGLAADPTSGAGQFSFSRTGTLVHRTGKVAAPSWPVSWLDNSGNTKPLIATPGFYLAPRFSPDGKRLALAQFLGSQQQIFVYDLQRGTMSRFFFKTGTQRSSYPIWSPDGKHIVCWFSSASGFSLGWMRADGAGETQRLLDSKNLLVPYSFFPDGLRLAYFELNPESGWDIWTLPLDLSDLDRPKPGKKHIFLRTASNELNPAVSPDGRWIAYQSDELGRYEVYVGPVDGQGGKRQISTGGGQLPVWSRNGRELFFENLDNRIMVMDYTATGASFMQGKPRVWSEQQLHEVGGMLNYDLSSKGELFAIFPEVKAPREEKGDVHMSFLLNFFDELRRRAPVDKR
jgi:serine/threonine protein kinase/Tol biopolymer transport system component